jgi:hypothetical protein
LTEYRAAVGHYPSPEEISDALNIDHDREVMARMSKDSMAWIRAEESVVSGCLQIAASRLLGQSTQEAAGSHEMYDGVIELEGLRSENRKRWAPQKASKGEPRRVLAKPRKSEKTNGKPKSRP